MVLQLALTLVQGKPFLGFPTHKSKVMYYAFEDDERRLRERQNKLLKGNDAPDDLLVSTEIRTLNDSLIYEMQEAYFEEGIDLFIIDTFQ